MMFGVDPQSDESVYSRRVKALLEAVHKQYPQVHDGCIILAASFEDSRVSFRQDSSFYYFTGITEPASVLMIDLDGTITIMAPQYAGNRSRWVASALDAMIEDPERFGVDGVEMLGGPVPGYQASAWMAESAYSGLCQTLASYIEKGGTVFVIGPSFSQETSDSRIVLERLKCFLPALNKVLVDISPIVGSMRRTKDMSEIEQLYAAVELSVLAHEAAAQAIGSEVLECEVQAQIEYIFTAAGARPSFPTIVASGDASTILHYTPSNAPLQAGDLVIVDCGADLGYYCGDLSRTYPVSGSFSPRQKEIYNVVLELQAHIAHIVKPGFWLSNDEQPDKSLNHLAKKYLQVHGFEKYYVHGIGHFLGLDVHDVGDIREPLSEGDIITIEPGLYLPDEKIGIRIEDNYWITKNGAICLSEALPKKPEDIELFMKGQNALCIDDESDSCSDDCCS